MASPKSKQIHHRAAGGANKQQALTSRAARRPLLLRRAMLHSCLCFLLGLFAGLAPSDWTDAASRAAATANAAATKQVFRALHAVRAINNISTTTTPHHHFGMHGYQYQRQQQDPQVLVVVTTTGGVSTERERRSAGLTRTAHALRLVSPPVVWLVVEAARDAADTALLLRRTGVVYRHVTYKENFSSSAAEEERHHQRTVAMGHIEQHRMRGVVLFAGLGDVYDLRLLEQLRRVRTFGAWGVATVWDKEKRVAVQGPACTTTTAGSWFSTRDAGEEVVTIAAGPRLADVEEDIHGFAFSSDLLLDAARWDRFPTSEPDQSQDSIKFVKRLLVEDYSKSSSIVQHNCSEIMAWRLVDTTLLLY